MQQLANTYIGKKIVLCGDTWEFYDYKKPIACDFKREHEIIKGSREVNEKRDDNLFRARKNVRQIIWSNETIFTKFLTLTCKDTVLDTEIFQKKMLKNFFRNMNRAGYKLKYLYVLEHQTERGEKEGNEGCLHAHIVIFNDEYIPYETINNCWNYGTTDIHILNGKRYITGEKINNVGAYICKYITKENINEFGSKCYKCSLGLKRPEEQRFYCYNIGNEEKSYFVSDGTDIGFYNALNQVKVINIKKMSYEFNTSDGKVIENTVKVTTGRVEE